MKYQYMFLPNVMLFWCLSSVDIDYVTYLVFPEFFQGVYLFDQMVGYNYTMSFAIFWPAARHDF